ncbi:MAG: V-type ATP synthase subunit D [Chloroflexi bacterium]|nr:V-type ATP synthase subunit D [Chloroflexota bacterium]MCL5950881.1 V-type ATP synthase subunit D [Chloroflexota bacterium]
MENVSPTRMELLAVKGQIGLAEQGRDLLKEKRNALMKEFMKIADAVMTGSDELERVAAEARRTLARAEALDGPEAVQSAAFAAQGELTLSVEGAFVMGVPVPVIEQKSAARSLVDRGYSLSGTSARIDKTAESFEEEVDLLIELAASELRLRRLAEEIRKTSRRVNALDNIMIPRLHSRKSYIEMVLEERAREDLFRLKTVKRAIMKKRAD